MSAHRLCQRPLPAARRRAASISRIAATSSPTASTRSARCGAAASSTSAATWPGSTARSTELRIAHADAAGRAQRRAARDGAPQPRARRPRLSAGDARRRPARPCVSRRRHGARASWSPPRSLDLASRARSAAANGIAVITVPDNRWERVDIKSVSLLPNVLAKQAAREQPAPTKPGSSTPTASSPKARRPTPGS